MAPAGAGTIVFRDQPGGGASETSQGLSLTDLPSTWSTRASWPDGPLSAYGVADVSVPAPDLLPPSAPLGLAITGAGQTSVSLSWPAATDNVGVSGYSVYRNGAGVGTTASTTYTVSGLACGTSYSFAVDAYDAAGNHSAKTTVTGATASCPAPTPTDRTAPSQPSGLTVSAPTQTGVTVSWTASTDNVGVAGYGVYSNGASAGSTGSTSYTISSLSCGTSYAFAVDAYDAAGNRSGQVSINAATAACPSVPAPAPQGSAAVVGTQTVETTDDRNNDGVVEAFRTTASRGGSVLALQLYLSSSSSATRVSAGIYSDAGGHPGTLLGRGSASANGGGWNAVPLSSRVSVRQGSVYWIAVMAPAGAGTIVFRDRPGGGASETSQGLSLTDLPSTWSTRASWPDGPLSAYGVADVSLPAPDLLPPSAPLGLAITGAGQTSVSLSWPAATDNVGVSGYSVYRNGAGVGTSASTAYTVSGLTCGTSYSFAVDAYDAAGNHSAKTTVTGATASCPAPTPTDTTAPSQPSGLTVSAPTQTGVTVSWRASTDNVGVAGYRVYSNGAIAGSTGSTSYTVSSLFCSTSYALSVEAYDAAGNRSARTSINAATAPCPDTQPPTTPTGLSASSVSTNGLTLSWNPSSDNVAAAGYGVYQSGTTIATVASTSYTVTGLACGTSYAFAIDAYDAAGNRSGKAAVTAQTSACPVAGPLLGVQTIAPNDDASSAGVAEAFRTTAAASGQLSSLNVYVSGSSTAGSIIGGLYSDAGGTPGTLLAQGSAAAPAGGWRTVPLPSPVAVSAGATYWIAVLTPPGSGTLVFRDVIGGGASETSAQSSMTSLPTAWRTGQSYPDGPISAYALSAGLGGTTPPPDTLPPSSVLGVAVSGATQTSVSLVWTPSSDNTAVAGYSVYRNGTLSGSTSSTSYGVSGLVCGTSYTFAVDAFDAAGNRSVRTSITGSTAPCGDGTAPSVPATLSSSATQSSITLTWAASTDNVAVAGYGLYRNGTAVGSAVTTSYSFSGLTCGTTYTLAADAYDAAGNRSAKASLTAPTSACPPPSSGLANLWVDASGGSCVRQASPAGYVDAQACSWDQAYQASQSG